MTDEVNQPVPREDDFELWHAQGRSAGWAAAVQSILESVRLHAAEVCGPAEQAALVALVAQACEVKMHGLGAKWRYYYDTSPLTEEEAEQLAQAFVAMRTKHVELTEHGAWLLRRQVANLTPEERQAALDRALARIRRLREAGK